MSSRTRWTPRHPFNQGLVLLVLIAAITMSGGWWTPTLAQTAGPLPVCQVVYVVNQWNTGFTAEIKLTNNGAPINGWTLTWAFSAGQQITSGWSATITQSGANVTAKNLDWNASLPTGGSAALGFQATHTGSNPTPTAFRLNGVLCNSSAQPTATPIGPTATPLRLTATPTRSPATATPLRPTATPTRPPATATPIGPTATPTTPTGDTSDDWLHTSGNTIVDRNGNPVWLTGANWFGYNATERVFHGLWQANLEQVVKAMAERGINIVRVPISTQLILEWKNGQFVAPNVNTYANPELVGMNSLQIFDHFLKISKKYGIKVMIDVHSADADNSGHIYPLWYKGTITPELFYQAWEWITARYKNDDTIVAMDIKNEPHGVAHTGTQDFAKWDGSTDTNNWKYACETASKRILAINPNVLVLCEGVEVYPKAGFTYASRDEKSYDFNWWGGNLRGVRDYPVNLGVNQDQLVYSPHDYGPLVFKQSWFYPGFNKDSLYRDVWQPNWFFIHEQNIAPLLLGEWGGFMDGGDNQKWMTALRDFIGEHHLHHTFWCLNPNSGDTGGLLLNDWTSWDEAKYALLKPTLWADRSGKFVGLDHQIPLGNSTVGTTVTSYYQSGNPAPTGN